MINSIHELLFFHKRSHSITNEQKESISYEIEIINFKRILVILTILFIIEILFILFVDIPNLTNNKSNFIWTDRKYLIIHISNIFISLFGIILFRHLLKIDKEKLKKTIYSFATPGITLIILILASMMNGLDQIKIGQSNSVFIANLLICGAVIILRFPTSIFIYTISYISFIIEMFIFQKNTALLYSNIINGTITVIAVIIISKTLYNSHFLLLYDKMILNEKNNKLNYLSSHDQLTGLLNRRCFELDTKQKLENKVLSKCEIPFFILLDIDHFKNVNDTYGHPIGDIVLKEVSNIILENIKESDLAARWGGEEFLLLLLLNSANDAERVANTIREAIMKKEILIDRFNIKITVSIGVAQIYGENLLDASYKSADEALYLAKSKGRNQVVLAK